MAGEKALLGHTWQLNTPRIPQAILDKSGCIIAVLVGMLKGFFEEEVVTNVTAVFEAEGQELSADKAFNPRGQFYAILAGFSHGRHRCEQSFRQQQLV